MIISLRPILWGIFAPLMKWKKEEEAITEESKDSQPAIDSSVSPNVNSRENDSKESPSVTMRVTRGKSRRTNKRKGSVKADQKSSPKSKKSSDCSKKDRKRHDQYISAYFRKIRSIPSLMINKFGQRSYFKPDDLRKNMICFSEVFSRIFCAIFSVHLENIYEGFLDFIVLKHVKAKAIKILNLFLDEKHVDEKYAKKFEEMLKLRKYPTKNNFIYFYQNNTCFRQMTDMSLAQIHQNMPHLEFSSFINEFVPSFTNSL